MHMIRGALVALLSLEDDMQVVAELERGDQIVPAALETRPSVAVIDIDLPGLDGLTAADQLYQRLPECQTLVPTGLSQPGNLLRVLKVHVRGFIVKDAPAETLANGVRRVANGEGVIDPELVAAALETGSTPLPRGKPTCSARPSTASRPTRSPPGCPCHRQPSATTCPTRSARSAGATASTPSASPATPAGSDQANTHRAWSQN